MPSEHPWLDHAHALTGASEITVGDRVQSLWSGYGEIVRASIDGTPIIVKHVSPPNQANHPRGWSTDRSHERKLRSYQVELTWYTNWSQRCPRQARVPHTIAAAELENAGWLFVLEDLDHAGYPRRHGRLDEPGVHVCLRWLANFHATFLGESPDGLWRTGTYWHLETRPDELDAMPAGDLKKAAGEIDSLLNSAHFQSLVHGDAKVANFCFAPDNTAVAAVDFQYVGGGPGIKDVAYFLGSCLDEHDCQRHEQAYLDLYFTALHEAVTHQHPGIDCSALETEWRTLFPVAWADFDRFLTGWCPGHPKMNTYSQRQNAITLARLNPDELSQ